MDLVFQIYFFPNINGVRGWDGCLRHYAIGRKFASSIPGGVI